LLSKAIRTGFTAAAAVIIAMSQARHLLGLTPAPEGSRYPVVVFYRTFAAVPDAHAATVVFSCTCVCALVALKAAQARRGAAAAKAQGVVATKAQGACNVQWYTSRLSPAGAARALGADAAAAGAPAGAGAGGAVRTAARMATRAASLLGALILQFRLFVVLAVATAAAYAWNRRADADLLRAATGATPANATSAAVAVVGAVPAGLGPLTVPPLFRAGGLASTLPSAFVCVLVGFMESLAVTNVYAHRLGYSVDPNRELVALGAASVSAAFVGGYPVAGALSRTAVNAQAGAVTPAASLVSGLTVICALLALTPLLESMPLAALSAIIVVSVVGLVDIQQFREAWRAARQDFFVMRVKIQRALKTLHVGMGIYGADSHTRVVLCFFATGWGRVRQRLRWGSSLVLALVLRHPRYCSRAALRARMWPFWAAIRAAGPLPSGTRTGAARWSIRRLHAFAT